jgi:hypothetical protein
MAFQTGYRKRLAMKGKTMNIRKIQQNTSAPITPAAFYKNEKDKTKLPARLMKQDPPPIGPGNKWLKRF